MSIKFIYLYLSLPSQQTATRPSKPSQSRQHVSKQCQQEMKLFLSKIRFFPLCYVIVVYCWRKKQQHFNQAYTSSKRIITYQSNPLTWAASKKMPSYPVGSNIFIFRFVFQHVSILLKSFKDPNISTNFVCMLKQFIQTFEPKMSQNKKHKSHRIVYYIRLSIKLQPVYQFTIFHICIYMHHIFSNNSNLLVDVFQIF